MSPRFIVRPLAEADLENAAQWYEEERPGLAQRFLKDVDRSFVRLRERPLQFPVVAGDVRRALLHTFPYAIYLEPLKRVRIIKRGPRQHLDCNSPIETSFIRAKHLPIPPAPIADTTSSGRSRVARGKTHTRECAAIMRQEGDAIGATHGS